MPEHDDHSTRAERERSRTSGPAALPEAAPPGLDAAPADALGARVTAQPRAGEHGASGAALQRRHADLLGDARLGEPVNAQRRADLFLQLQRSYGNRHLQAVVGLVQASRQAAPTPVQRDPDPPAAKDPQLLLDFEKSFADSAALIRKSPAALKLVGEAAAASVKFGGFAEDGPGKSAWPYTAGDTVYVPRAHTDKVTAMDDFLFELNNAIRKPAFDKLFAEAAKGSKGTLTAKDYAYKVVEQEVEGMLRLGEVWFETKKTMGGGKALDKYDAENYLAEYQDFKAGKKTKDDIIKSVLARVYQEGTSKGKTVEQNYMEQYQSISGGK